MEIERDRFRKMLVNEQKQQEQNAKLMARLVRTQLFVIVIGVFLIMSIAYNIYATRQFMFALMQTEAQVLVNRQETIRNRNFSDSILNKLDSFMKEQDSLQQSKDEPTYRN